MVGIGYAAQQRAHVEGFLAFTVDRGIEYLAERAEAAARPGVRRRGDVPADGVGGRGWPGEAVAWRSVGVLVVCEQDVHGGGQVGCPVLGLAVRAHDPVVAADADRKSTR